jgi:hypothetical protein
MLERVRGIHRCERVFLAILGGLSIFMFSGMYPVICGGLGHHTMLWNCVCLAIME